MSNMLQRTITGALLLAVIIGSILVSEYTFLVCIGALLSFTLFEFYGIVKNESTQPQNILGYFIGIGLFVYRIYIPNNILISIILRF